MNWQQLLLKVACGVGVEIKEVRSHQGNCICTHLSAMISMECPTVVQYLWTACIEFNGKKFSLLEDTQDFEIGEVGRSLAWISSDYFESLLFPEGVITTRSNRMKFRLGRSSEMTDCAMWNKRRVDNSQNTILSKSSRLNVSCTMTMLVRPR